METRKKLDELIAIIDSYYDDYQDDYDENSTNCPTDDLQSTGYSEEEEVFEEKKKRRRKVKENDLLVDEAILLSRLNSMVLREDNRVACRVSEEDVNHWRAALQDYRHSFK